MSGRPERAPAWEEFLPLWESLREASLEPRTTIVVEGERDVRSLRRLGVEGVIVPVHQGHPLSELAHKLGGKGRRVILLTDWDSEGGALARRLKGFLEAGDAHVDLEFRRKLARVLRGEIVHVEGLSGWARRVAESEGRPLEEWLAELDQRTAPRPTG